MKEINDHTDINISYSQIKSGRVITGFKFNVKRSGNNLKDVTPTTFKESSKLLCILSILEGSPFYNKRTGETIYPAPGFNIIATANTKGYGSEDGKYLSQIMDQAFLERFGITVDQNYPDAKTETAILSKVLDDKDFVANLIKWANVIRETYNQGGIDDFISTRRLIHIANAFSIFKNKKKAIELCVARFDSSTKEAFIDLYSKVDAGEELEEVDSIKVLIDEWN